MPDAYYDITAQTTAQLISSAGTNVQEQAWSSDVCLGSLMRSMFGRVMDEGVDAKRPIKNILSFRGIKGQVLNIQSRAPIGASPGVQGSAANRVSKGENRKLKMWTMNIGVQWQGVKSNLIARDQTVLGVSDFDGQAREGLKDIFSLIQSRTIEATMIQRASARTTLYANGKTSIDSLRSADTFTFNTVQRISDGMQNNMAAPISVAMPKSGKEPIKGYYVIAPAQLLADMEQSSDYQSLMAVSRERGDANTLFYGGIPMIGNNIVDRYVVQSDDSDGPKGTLGVPLAYLGGAIIKAPATGAFMLGGGSAAAAAITDPDPPLFFLHFANAEFKTFEVIKLAADTSTTRYCLARDAASGKWRMYSYVVNNGNKLTLTGALIKSTSTPSGTGIDSTTVGNVTAANTPGSWQDSDIAETNSIGDVVIQCNSYGVPYVRGYALADEAMYSAYGMLDNKTAMGQRTELDGFVVNHGRESEIGLAMNWGVEAVSDANDLKKGFMVIVGAWTPDGVPALSQP